MANTLKGSRILEGAASRTGVLKKMARADLHLTIRLKVAATQAAVERGQTLSGLMSDALAAFGPVREKLQALEGRTFEDEGENEKEI